MLWLVSFGFSIVHLKIALIILTVGLMMYTILACTFPIVAKCTILFSFLRIEESWNWTQAFAAIPIICFGFQVCIIFIFDLVYIHIQIYIDCLWEFYLRKFVHHNLIEIIVWKIWEGARCPPNILITQYLRKDTKCCSMDKMIRDIRNSLWNTIAKLCPIIMT